MSNWFLFGWLTLSSLRSEHHFKTESLLKRDENRKEMGLFAKRHRIRSDFPATLSDSKLFRDVSQSSLFFLLPASHSTASNIQIENV